MAEAVVEAVDEKKQAAELEQKIRQQLEAEYQSRLEVQLAEISQKMTEENKKMVHDAMERYRKEMAPPTDEEIKKLLSQEYAEFTFEIQLGRKKDGETQKKTFVIRELPQSVEKEIFKKVKTILIPFSTELAGVTMNLMDGEAGKKIVQIMNTFEPMLNVMTAICTLSLNPFGEDQDVDEKWVADNLSSTRIAKIVTAQMECNKVRDFLSLLFRGARQTM